MGGREARAGDEGLHGGGGRRWWSTVKRGSSATAEFCVWPCRDGGEVTVPGGARMRSGGGFAHFTWARRANHRPRFSSSVQVFVAYRENITTAVVLGCKI